MKKEESKERVKRVYAQKGQRNQDKSFTFRLDNEVAEWLYQQPNKGRYLNDLILADWKTKNSE